jgi:hypothetical protein
VSHESLVRTAAVVAAVAFLAAPYRQQIAGYVSQAAEAAKAHGALAGRIAAAALLIAAAWGKVPMPSLPSTPAVPVVTVDAPSPAMRATVQPIADALKAAPLGDRMLWANLWSKAATVVAGDELGTEVVLTDTRALRMFTTLALDIGWRRIGENKPGTYAGLRQAVEKAMGDTLSLDARPIDVETRAKVVELYKAIAWAGTAKE